MTTAKAVLTLAKDAVPDELVDEIHSQQDIYRQGKPYREPFSKYNYFQGKG